MPGCSAVHRNFVKTLDIITTTVDTRTMTNTENTCNASTSDGNADDPTYAYCDLPAAHAGDHHYTV